MAKTGKAGGSSRIEPETYRADPLFPEVERAVQAILATGNVVTPVDLLVGLGVLAPADLATWRRGKLPSLEQVLQGNLAKAHRAIRIMGCYCAELGMTGLTMAYMQDDPRKALLQFSKTGEGKVESLYARHFVRSGPPSTPSAS